MMICPFCDRSKLGRHLEESHAAPYITTYLSCASRRARSTLASALPAATCEDKRQRGFRGPFSSFLDRHTLSRARLITTIKCPAPAFSTIMLAAEHSPDILSDVKLPNQGLWEVHRSKISLHRAKAGYDYPTIRLPYIYAKLAGLSTRIYQTIYDGSLAFLTVISPTENASKTPKASVFTRR
jgi:hypothetical protein